MTYFPEIFFSVVSKQYFELQSSRMVITKMRALRIQTNTPMNEIQTNAEMKMRCGAVQKGPIAPDNKDSLIFFCFSVRFGKGLGGADRLGLASSEEAAD